MLTVSGLDTRILKSRKCKQALAEVFTDNPHLMNNRPHGYTLTLLTDFRLKYPEFVDISKDQFRNQIETWRCKNNVDSYCDPIAHRTKMRLENIAKIKEFLQSADLSKVCNLRQEHELCMQSESFKDNFISYETYRRLRLDAKIELAIDKTSKYQLDNSVNDGDKPKEQIIVVTDLS